MRFEISLSVSDLLTSMVDESFRLKVTRQNQVKVERDIHPVRRIRSTVIVVSPVSSHAPSLDTPGGCGPDHPRMVEALDTEHPETGAMAQTMADRTGLAQLAPDAMRRLFVLSNDMMRSETHTSHVGNNTAPRFP